MTLLFATNNQHKIEEIRAALDPSIHVTGLQEAGIHTDIPEPYDTLEENAYAKSSTIYAMTAMNCFSEDTGLEVVSLGGAPGVRSARYAGDNKHPEANLDKLLSAMQGITDRRARFRTVISLIIGGAEHRFEGICEGNLLGERSGAGGFGYDPIFVPTGADHSFAQMDIAEKNKFSHRRKAVDLMALFLQRSFTSANSR